MKLIKLSSRKHPGLFAKVDDEDYESLNQFSWYPQKSQHTFYAWASKWIGKQHIYFSMHRMILKITDSKLEGDHKNSDGLDNQKDNLRIATRSQNSSNRQTVKGSSKYLGVSFDKERKKYRAILKKNYKSYMKRCDTEIEAALVYNEMAVKYHGEFARLNVISD